MQSWKVARLGMARTFQMLRLFPQLTIRANMVMAESWRMRSGYLGSAMGSRKAKLEETELSHRAEVLLAEFDMAEFADRFPGELSIGQQRLVEIARSLMGSPRLLLLDEPAAGLSPPNVDRLIQHIHDIRDKRGTSIILVEHVMKVVMAACDRVAVLDQGSKIADGLPAEIVNNPAVISAYLGVEKESPDARGA
jgi:branched-chain amino acid transport system ATP-binding protein